MLFFRVCLLEVPLSAFSSFLVLLFINNNCSIVWLSPGTNWDRLVGKFQEILFFIMNFKRTTHLLKRCIRMSNAIFSFTGHFEMLNMSVKSCVLVFKFIISLFLFVVLYSLITTVLCIIVKEMYKIIWIVRAF